MTKTYHITYDTSGITIEFETSSWFTFMQKIEAIDNDRYVINGSVKIWTTEN